MHCVMLQGVQSVGGPQDLEDMRHLSSLGQQDLLQVMIEVELACCAWVLACGAWA